MIIQCQHCNANFKIDKDKIPSKKSYVRCAKCSQLISLGGTKEKEPTPQKTVVANCNNCGVKYGIPTSKFKKDTIKVKCGKCGFYFNVSKNSDSEPEKVPKKVEGTHNVSNLMEDEHPAFDIPKRINVVKEEKPVFEEEVDVNDIKVTKEEVDDIFSDFSQDYDEDDGISEFGEDDALSDLGLDDDIHLDENPISVEEDSNKAYLESIQLTTEDETDSELAGIDGTIPADQKSKFFLRPGAVDELDIETEENGWPEIQDETIEETKGDSFQSDVLESSMELGGNLTNSDEGSENSGSEKTSRLIPALVLFVALVTALGAFGWYFYQQKMLLTPDQSGLQSEEYSSQSKLQILEPLKGKYLKNRAINKKIFILQGKVKNFYDGADKINHVEVEGILYDDEDKILSESKAFAGNNLTESQLETLSEQEIKSLIASRSDSSAVALDLGFNQVVPFQIIFFNVPPKVGKLEARILRFSKRK